MKIKEKECESCGMVGMAQIGMMPSTIIEPDSDPYWVQVESCIHCGASKKVWVDEELLEKRLRDYANFLLENGIVDEQEVQHLL